MDLLPRTWRLIGQESAHCCATPRAGCCCCAATVRILLRRLLDSHAFARLDRNLLTIGTGEQTFGTITLDLGDQAQVWASSLRRLRTERWHLASIRSISPFLALSCWC